MIKMKECREFIVALRSRSARKTDSRQQRSEKNKLALLFSQNASNEAFPLRIQQEETKPQTKEEIGPESNPIWF